MNQSKLLEAGREAFQKERYTEAIQLIQEFCQRCTNPQMKDYILAQMLLVKAYQQTGQLEAAISLCQKLITQRNSQVSTWAEQTLKSLNVNPSINATITTEKQINQIARSQKTQRSAQLGIKLKINKFSGNLAFASTVTLSLLFGMVLVLILAITLIINSKDPINGFFLAIIVTIIFNILGFFLSPWLMDLIQNCLYQTRWVSIAEIEEKSPESAGLIRRICQENNLQQPYLGIIDDENPTAFTYGALPNSARLVVSKGLFTYLDDEEIASVYAHEIGHIIHWDFAVMTVASTLVQITYLIYTFADRMGRGNRDSKEKDAIATAALVAYIFYIIGTYLLLYLSRTREYFADHFAAEVTGNPNALSRALVKIAYGILEESKGDKTPSRLLEGTRALGISDRNTAISTGTAYRIATDYNQIGRVFLWDLFNPWAWWMELNSTHPLTGKRIRALSNYAEQLGLDIEFNMGQIVAEGRHLSKSKLYGNFLLDLILYSAEFLGIFVGLIIGLLMINAQSMLIITCPLIGLGIGIILKTLVMFPDYQKAEATDILTLMADPYSSPLRGKPAKLTGKLIGRGDAGYIFGSDIQFQDKTGLLFLRYASRFGPIGNFLFGMTKVKSLIGMETNTLGWFRRSITPWMDLIQITTENGTIVNSYHRFWSVIFGGGSIILGIVFLIMF